ncbi:MAG: hypothetical protein INR73_25775 [Williamsia sp.]|nr:hypothetical protein [Williamsia sp.]
MLQAVKQYRKWYREQQVIQPLLAAVKTACAVFTFVIMLTFCKTAVASNIFGTCFVYHDSIVVKILQSKKPSLFELYPDVSQEVLLFTAKGARGKMYQLFLFDIGGKPIRQIQVHSNETTLLSGLAKGDYLFEVLSNDDRIGNGNVTIR